MLIVIQFRWGDKSVIIFQGRTAQFSQKSTKAVCDNMSSEQMFLSDEPEHTEGLWDMKPSDTSSYHLCVFIYQLFYLAFF